MFSKTLKTIVISAATALTVGAASLSAGGQGITKRNRCSPH